MARNEKFLDMSSNIANSVITNVKTAQTKVIFILFNVELN